MTATAFVVEQFSETYPPGIENHFWTHARNRIILREVRAALAKLPGAPRLLEIGCGAGVVLRYLRENGIDCDGVEPGAYPMAPELAPYVRSGIDCFQIAAAERGSYAGLLLFDVLEHIADPIGFLAQIRESYPNAKFLLLTVPARMELWSNYDDHFGHFRRYATSGLKRELSKAGFTNIRSRYLFRALYPVMLALKHLSGQRATTTLAPSNVGIHRLMANCFVLEDMVLPSGLPGTSIIATASCS